MVETEAGLTDKFVQRAREMDAADKLAGMRDRFHIPPDTIYLDGNSLGPMPKGVAERLAQTISHEWADDLITSWNKVDWVGLPQRIATKIARLTGAAAHCVAVTDSTSVNLFKVLSAALGMKAGRRTIVTERDNFPTDIYMAEGLCKLIGEGHEIVLVDDPHDIESALNDRTAVLMLTHVNYKTGQMHDMTALTAAAHAAGALAIWDLAHSAGAVEVDLAGTGADFAVGCGYKYLNGGPGAPAFLYVAEKHHDKAQQPLTGWFSHAAPFAFEPTYQPAGGISQFYTGTPPVLSLAALDVALEVWEGVDISDVRQKSLALTGIFIEVVEALCSGQGLSLATPREAGLRGSQVSFRLPEHGYAVMQALISRGVIGDFRAPDIIRFGFTPLYTRFEDVVLAAATLADILSTRAWADERFQQRSAVT